MVANINHFIKPQKLFYIYSMEQKINVGLVSYGMAGRIFHAPFIHCHPHLHLYKVVERHKENSRKDYPYTTVVRSLESLLEDEKVDIVVVATPPRLHHEQAKKALEAGKHVIVEKPFTATSDQAKELIALAEKNNCMLSVYQNRRFTGDYYTAKKIIADGILGDLVAYDLHIERFRNFLRPGAWKENKEPGAGLVYDLGSHLLDHAFSLFGYPKTLWADIRKQRGGEMDDFFEIKLNYGQLLVTLKSGLLVKEPGPHIAIHGTQGSFVKYGMDPQEAALNEGKMPQTKDWIEDPEENWGLVNYLEGEKEVKQKIKTLTGSFGDYYDNIYNVIVNDEDLKVKPAQAMHVIQAIELAQKSSNEGCKLPFTFY